MNHQPTLLTTYTNPLELVWKINFEGMKDIKLYRKRNNIFKRQDDGIRILFNEKRHVKVTQTCITVHTIALQELQTIIIAKTNKAE